MFNAYITNYFGEEITSLTQENHADYVTGNGYQSLICTEAFMTWLVI